MNSDRDADDEILPSTEPPFQAVSPNLDKLSRASLEPGTVSRRRIVRTSIALIVLLLVVAGGVAWWIALS
ncbi:hypothetical protein [Agromyces italicus]|uniref:hypothetical protein n=1 Tax=Agromyces italicus TaxID=279572 RepID=UPI0003B72C95|nr:hypothetical protein [Agromyces italicus]